MNTSSVIEAPSGTAQQSVPHRPEFFNDEGTFVMKLPDNPPKPADLRR